MPSVILRPYFHTFCHRFDRRRRSVQHGKKDLLLFGITLFVMATIFSSFVTILSLFSQNAVLTEIIPSKIVELIYYTFFILLIISNTIAHTGNIYTAQNMDLLLTTPVSKLRLFTAKLLESTIETSIMFLVFAIPVALAFLYALDISVLFILAAILLSIPFVLTASAIGLVFATVFVRFASIVWKRGVFLLASLGVVLSYAMIKLVGILSAIDQQGGGKQAIIKIVGIFENPNPLWLPSRWTSDLLLFFVSGRVNDPGLKILLLLATAIGTIAIAYIIFDLFILGVKSAASVHAASARKEQIQNSNSQSSDSIKNTGQFKDDIIRRSLEFIYNKAPVSAQTRAIILKDLTSLVRDRAQSLQLLMYLGVALVYLVITEFMSTALNLAPVARQAWLGFLASVNVVFAGFIVTAVMTRLVFPSISLEGKAFWIINSGPITFQKLIRAKFYCWFPLTLGIAISLLLAGVLAIHPGAFLIATSIFIATSISIGCTGLAVGVGSLFASFHWESPNQISSGFGTLVLLLSSIVLVILTTIPASVLTFLSVVPAARMKLGANIWPLLMIVCAVLVLSINLIAANYACKRGAQSLAKLNS